MSKKNEQTFSRLGDSFDHVGNLKFYDFLYVDQSARKRLTIHKGMNIIKLIIIIIKWFQILEPTPKMWGKYGRHQNMVTKGIEVQLSNFFQVLHGRIIHMKNKFF